MRDKLHLARRNWTKAIATAAVALSLSLLVVSYAQMAQLDAANARISAVYQKAFYETCELTEALSVNFRKLLVASDGAQIQQLLNEIAQQTQGASGDLALLPLGEETISATIKFINQAGDFAETLSVRLAEGGAVREEDYETMATLSNSASAFTLGMVDLLNRYENGEVALSGEMASGIEQMYPLTNPASEYPTLLYDGPFSDGSQGETFNMLNGMVEISAEQAQQKLVEFFGTVTDIALTGEGSIPVPCYEFELTVNGYPLSAGVTKRGGEVLYVLSGADVMEVNYSAEQLLEMAQNFLLSRGYGDMDMSYYSQYDGILTINYAAVQDDVVLYPDLIKLQLSMRDGTVIGMEAANYLMNHVHRVLPSPVLSEEEALARVNSALTANSIRLCVIPLNSTEALCYEVRATDGSGEFLVYIDAITGVERELMQVVSNENGTLVM